MQNGSDDADDMKARLAKLANELQTRREADNAEQRRQSETGASDKSLGRAMGSAFACSRNSLWPRSWAP